MSNLYSEISNLVMLQAMTLEERLACLLRNRGGRSSLPQGLQIKEVHAFNGMSGYNYWDKDILIAQLYMGTLVSGTYVIYKKTFIDDKLIEIYDYYDPEGNFFYQSNSLDGQCITYNSISMDPLCPFINHIYNILHNEYQGTTFNYGNTGRIQYLESLLNKFYLDKNIKISVEDGIKDKAIRNISAEAIQIEKNAVLKWAERQAIFKQLKEVRSSILATKRRAHNFQYMLYDFLVMLSDVSLKYHTFKQRPVNNFIGSFYKNTLGNLFWFADTVKSNLGYSVALAIYGPFTFYFITQPMNPHAMWAVGKVRNAYIQTVKFIENPEGEKQIVIANTETEKQEDEVTTAQAAPSKGITTTPLLDWDTRMSNFKAMQISYEEAMVFAERMGRIEQFETQLNFPLTAEAAWMEMELYLTDVTQKLEYFKNLDERFANFLKAERDRTLELQLYIWQKMGQFFMDHPYIVVDQDDEQTQRNYYLGRQFVFFKTMTKKITKMGLADSPTTHKNIDMLATKFEKLKVEGSSIMDTLKKNSKIFQQKNFLSSDEHRDYMKRHWEILFMQQNKKQEAASFSLQAYTWSVRNAIWLLQTIYSAKRSELWALTANYNLDNFGQEKVKPNPEMNEYLANMFNNLVMEFVSIKKEIVQNLPGDTEGKLRTNVINNVKQYIIERDQLFNQGVYAKKVSKSNRI